MSAPTEDAVREALNQIINPELRRSITDLGMVESIEISETGAVTVGVLLTVAGCPLKDTITADTTSINEKISHYFSPVSRRFGYFGVPVF